MLLARVASDDGDLVRVYTTWHPAVVAQFKAMPGCVWNSEERAWAGPREAVLDVLKTLERAKVVVVDGQPIAPPVSTNQLSYPGRMYEYQRDGVRFLCDSLTVRHGALLGDDMGLGKSAQTAVAANCVGAAHTLILCPAVVVTNWLREWQLWTGSGADILGRKLTRGEGAGRLVTFDNGGVLVGSYDTFRSLVRKYDVALADMIVLDELHYLSNPTSQRSKAVREYIAKCRKHRYPVNVIGLTGTPMTARPRDLWNPLDLIYPKRFGPRFAFEKRYCDGRWEEIQGLDKAVWSASGQSNLDELGRRLQSVMLRRVKGDVLELPARQRIMLPVEMPPSARKAVAKASAALRLSQDLGSLLSSVEEYKLSAAAELALDLMAQGRRPLLFTLRRETAHKLGNVLKAPVVTGEDAAGERVAKLSGHPCGVATIYSVTTGINLVEFDTVIFVGLDWVPSTMLQAEARIHRIGQDKSVLFYYLIGLGTVDEVVQSKVLLRLDNFAAVVGNTPDENGLAGTLRGAQSEAELLADIVKAVTG